jgi:hypothetical protein
VQVVQEGGYRGLWRGLTLNYIKVVPSTAVGFTIYDAAKQYLGLEGNMWGTFTTGPTLTTTSPTLTTTGPTLTTTDPTLTTAISKSVGGWHSTLNPKP